MSRLLTLILIFVVVTAHGSSLAAAVCRHQNGGEHAAALRSADSGISAAASTEEAAGKAASRKGVPVDPGSVSSPSDMLPNPGLAAPFRVSEPIERSLADAAIPAGASVLPLLQPPSV